MRNTGLFRLEVKTFRTVVNLGQKLSEENQATCSLRRREFSIYPDLNAVDNLICKSLVS